MEFLVEHLPPQAHLMILTRADPGLRVGWLRATGQLAEIRAAELAFTAEETSSHAGRRARSPVRRNPCATWCIARKGGRRGSTWPRCRCRGESDPDEFIREVSGGNRFIGDYLTEEVLAGHSDEIREFIRTMSILDRFSARACDFMTGGTGSAAILHELERTNLFLVPLDESRTWFRFHHLFASVAGASWRSSTPNGLRACTPWLLAGSATTAMSTRR